MQPKKIIFLINFLSVSAYYRHLSCSDEPKTILGAFVNRLQHLYREQIAGGETSAYPLAHPDSVTNLSKCFTIAQMSDQLYVRYTKILPGLNRFIYNKVFNDFLDSKNLLAVYAALEQDTEGIVSEFGQAVERLIVIRNDLFARYQALLSEFPEEFFNSLFDQMVNTKKIDCLVDAVEQDVSEISSEFGIRVMNLALADRNHWHELKKLEATMRDEKRQNIFGAVQSVVLCNNLYAKSNFVPEFFGPIIGLLSEEINNPSKNVHYCVERVLSVYEYWVAFFDSVKPKKSNDSIDRQKYIQSFLGAIDAHAKNGRGFGIIERIDQRFIPGLFNKELAKRNILQEQDEQKKAAIAAVAQAQAVRGAPAHAQFVMENNLDAVKKEFDRFLQKEVQRRYEIANQQTQEGQRICDQAASEQLEAQRQTVLRQKAQQAQQLLVEEAELSIQQKAQQLAAEAQVSIFQIKSNFEKRAIVMQARDSLLALVSGFIEGRWNIVADRLHARKIKEFANSLVYLEMQSRNNLAIEEGAEKTVLIKESDLSKQLIQKQSLVAHVAQLPEKDSGLQSQGVPVVPLAANHHSTHRRTHTQVSQGQSRLDTRHRRDRRDVTLPARPELKKITPKVNQLTHNPYTPVIDGTIPHLDIFEREWCPRLDGSWFCKMSDGALYVEDQYGVHKISNTDGSSYRLDPGSIHWIDTTPHVW